jgi:hypothetical protein
VALRSAHFELEDGGGYLPTDDESLGLPCNLDPGESLPKTFDAEDLWEGTQALVMHAYDHEHRYVFEQEVREQWERWRQSEAGRGIRL